MVMNPINAFSLPHFYLSWGTQDRVIIETSMSFQKAVVQPHLNVRHEKM